MAAPGAGHQWGTADFPHPPSVAERASVLPRTSGQASVPAYASRLSTLAHPSAGFVGLVSGLTILAIAFLAGRFGRAFLDTTDIRPTTAATSIRRRITPHRTTITAPRTTQHKTTSRSSNKTLIAWKT